MIRPMTEARRQHVHGPLHHDRKYLSPSIKWALLLWVVILIAWWLV